ncbi:hypothetical protein BGZ76_003618 [Entomortierella beljakovae]|nr:hypothetical protein BGZ76_003618 [Entomortierella beljakovae]
MKDKSIKSIKGAFEEYYNDRFAHAERAFDTSSGMSKLLNGQRFHERLFRKIVLNYIPGWVFDATFAKTAAYRPQVAWLPLITNRGNSNILPQHWEVKSQVPVPV